MQSLLKNNTAQKIMATAICSMLLGLFVSRALLSISMIMLIAGGLLQINATTFKNVIKHPLVWMGLVLFIVPFLSGLWSDDIAEWWRRCQMKLPLLLLPIAFLSYPALPKHWFTNISWLFIGLTMLGCCWSLSQYMANYQTITEGYLRAKVMPTPFDNNHLWFSYAVVVSLLLLYQIPHINIKKSGKAITYLLTAFFVVYLHLLAAKTGLACLYLATLIQVVVWMFQPSNRKKAIIILLAMIALPVIAYTTIPTFRNRIQYIRYDIGEMLKGNTTRELNDGARLRSIKAGWEIYQTDQLKGVGIGDMMPLTQQWYNQQVPPLQPWEKLMPSSEWIIYPMSAGILGWLAIALAAILPFFAFTTTSGKILACLSAFICTYDIPLEGQFSVMIFIFPLLWWMIKPRYTNS
jgi:hypothetical protein